jgi:S-adenosylmethionine-diacylglycerol 3-amino-3-carboxypropyl transferase
VSAPGTETEIASRASFDLIRYAQVWEDADILAEALRPGPEDTVVSIASAGDNALALLAEGPARVVAVDMNPCQLQCVRIRAAAYRTLDHAGLLELMGSRPSGQRGELLDRSARALSAEDQAFWAPRREAVIRHGLGGVGKFERYFRIFRRFLLPLVHGADTVREALRPKSPEERASFYERRWNTWRWRRLVGAFFSRPVMGRLGRDPAFFDQVQGSVAAHVAERTRRAFVEQDPSRNPYLAWILTGRHGAALPRALAPERFEAIRDRLDRLEIRLGTVESLGDAGFAADAFNLSDIFEYMSPEAHEAAYCSVLAVARPGARIAYWNMMAPRRVPTNAAARVRTRSDLESRLAPADKAFFYRDFVIEEAT